MKTISSEIARRRLAQQRLAGGALSDAAEVVRWLGAVQAQDFAGAKWALGRRTADARERDVQAAFDAGKILRTHVLRPTWHFVLPEDIRWMLRLSAPRVKAAMAARDRELGLTKKVVGRSQEAIAAALRGGKFLTREEIGVALEKRKIVASGQRLAHIMMAAELDALVCSGPRRGKQFTYALLEERAPAVREWDRDEAVAELARRYFRSHGPATVQDFAWWSGLTMADAKTGVREAGLSEEKLGGRTFWRGEAAALSPATAKTKTPAVDLLPSYDEFVVGLRDRSDICAAEIAAKLPRTANGLGGMLGSMLVVDGQIVGTWRRETIAGRLVIETKPLRRLSAAEQRGLRRAEERLRDFWA